METGQVRFRNKQHRTIAQRTGIHGADKKKKRNKRERQRKRDETEIDKKR